MVQGLDMKNLPMLGNHLPVTHHAHEDNYPEFIARKVLIIRCI
jgi:hypothetical protein